ncbi:MAG: ferritin-like domain-containing protein [Sphingomonadaceae bacterium]|nr:ferritin-like domain-containing protein [Sphingomonadaceae bacterium]
MIQDSNTTRRSLFRVAGAGVLSAAAVGLLGNNAAMAAMKGKAGASANDVAILNVALGLEHEAINAYQIGAESGLLDKGTLGVAVGFQSDHKFHRDALIATIKKLGGKAVAEKSRDEYVTGLNAASIKTATDIVKLAQRLELGAVNAYLGVIPSFSDKALAQVSGKLAADEVLHYTALTSALGEQLPVGVNGFPFG